MIQCCFITNKTKNVYSKIKIKITKNKIIPFKHYKPNFNQKKLKLNMTQPVATKI